MPKEGREFLGVNVIVYVEAAPGGTEMMAAPDSSVRKPKLPPPPCPCPPASLLSSSRSELGEDKGPVEVTSVGKAATMGRVETGEFCSPAPSPAPQGSACSCTCTSKRHGITRACEWVSASVCRCVQSRSAGRHLGI